MHCTVSMCVCCVFQTAIGEFTFILFMILMIGFTLFVFFKVPETKNRTFEEIASLFAPGGTIEVEEMVDDPVVAYSDNDVIDADLRLKSTRNGSVSQDDVFVKTGDDERRSLTRSAENINKDPPGGVNPNPTA